MVDQPNILILLTDQFRYDALSCNGAQTCRTPAIDSIAGQGMRFTRAYTPVALCTPARASLFSGQYPHNHGQLSNMGNFNGVFDQQILGHSTLFPQLQEAGYSTGYVGKWHLPKEGDLDTWGIDTWHTFDNWFRWLEQPDYDFARDEVQRLEWGPEAPFAGCSTLPAEKMREAWTADRAIDLIEQHTQAGEPFAVMASFFGPHFPYSVPKPYDSLYHPASVEKPINFDEQFVDKPLIQQKELLRWNSAHLTWSDWQRVIAIYWGYCSYIDDQIKRVLECLDQAGVGENTVVIFSADHGDMLGSHRLFNKGFHMYEETHHIPMVVRAPGMTQPGTVCDSFLNLVDIAPTLLELAGAEALANADGRSFVPLLSGESIDDWTDVAYAEFHGYESTLYSTRMVRTTKWKYVYNPASLDELYDLESDPGELRNLASQIGYKHILRRMKELLVERMNELNDNIVNDNAWQGNSYDLYLSRREK